PQAIPTLQVCTGLEADAAERVFPGDPDLRFARRRVRPGKVSRLLRRGLTILFDTIARRTEHPADAHVPEPPGRSGFVRERQPMRVLVRRRGGDCGRIAPWPADVPGKTRVPGHRPGASAAVVVPARRDATIAP